MLDVLGGYRPTSTFLGGYGPISAFLGGVRTLRPSAMRLRDPPTDVFDTFPNKRYAEVINYSRYSSPPQKKLIKKQKIYSVSNLK